jgi:hypothetical protein
MLQTNIPVIQTSNSKAQGAIANHCALATSDHDPRGERAKDG